MNALVVGMGVSGFSIAAHLLDAAGGARAQITAVDSRAKPPMAAQLQKHLPQVKTMTGEDFYRWDERRFLQYDRIALSPGVPPQRVNAPAAKITGDAALFAESFARSGAQTKLLAITGTNGKSTTVSLAHDLCLAAGLRADVAGNIGEPLLAALARWRRCGFPDVAVLELSSFQLETAPSLPLWAAAALNIDDDHLDRHGDMDSYAAIKARIYDGAKYCIINADDKRVMTMPVGGRRVLFSMSDAKCDWFVRDERISGEGCDYPLAQISADAQTENVLAALALTGTLVRWQEDGRRAAMQKALMQFAALPHRRREVLMRGGVSFVDDSKATNVHSSCFALRSIDTPAVLIAGGDGKGQRFTPLAKTAKGRVCFAVVIGKDAPKLQAAFSAEGVKTLHAPTMARAVVLAYQHCPPGGAVLLSPACSSLDMFADYRARGDAFLAAAQSLPQRFPEGAKQ
ncbi:MAG: UDP-N-acetylmuramoyl-L-alanine--D-glutamate ligase [Gammaproteobacteria bacterium]